MQTQAGNAQWAVAEINVVPLIDILLVLLIIFMVITPLTPQGLEAVLPQPAPDVAPREPLSTVVVQVSRQGLKVNQEEVSWESLGPRLAEIFKRRARKVAFVQGHAELQFAEVARVVDVMRAAGIDTVGLLTPQTLRGT